MNPHSDLNHRPDPLLTELEACEFLRIRPRQLYAGRKQGLIPFILAIAFALSYQWSRKLEEETDMKRKTHGYRAKSVFRQGFEHLRQMITRPATLAEGLSDFLRYVVASPLAGKIIVSCELS